jgi:hypothetical protein
MLYLSNAFSLNMIDQHSGSIEFHNHDVNHIKQILGNRNWVSVVGHQDTANLLSGMLGTEVAFNRQSLKLAQGDQLIVAQYSGARLPEGATELPEGATVKWFMLSLVDIIQF